MTRRLPSRGFTLIELMVTIAIIGVMMALAAPSFGTAARQARERTAVQRLAQDFVWARGAAAVNNASLLDATLSGVPVVAMKIYADCTWTMSLNSTTSTAASTTHSMTATALAALAPGAACTGSNGISLPATFTFAPQGSVDTTGKVTFTGATGQDFPLQILYSGSMIRAKNAS